MELKFDLAQLQEVFAGGQVHWQAHGINSVLGLLIYLAMLLWAGAAVAFVRGQWRGGMGLFGGGSAALVAAFVLRWVQVEHAPLQNMFEVMLALGVVMFPLWLFCARWLGARFPAAVAILGIVVLVPPGFVSRITPDPQDLPPALQSWLFVPHVSAYMLAYAILMMACIQAAGQLLRPVADGFGDRSPDEAAALQMESATFRLIRLGFPLLTVGLILGAVWGKLAWGDYWGWDPKELWSLVTLLVYLGYLHFRGLCGTKHPRANAALALAGGACVIITLLWVNLSRLFPGLHNYAT